MNGYIIGFGPEQEIYDLELRRNVERAGLN